jgi:nucleoid DNA-binding protein
MEQLLYKYLVLHQNLSIPQLGSFQVVQVPARLDTETENLYPPQPVIRFSESTNLTPNKSFYTFLAQELGMDELTVIKQFHDFCYELRKNITDKKEVVLNGWGKIWKGEDASLQFEQVADLSAMLPVYHLSKDQVAAVIASEEYLSSEETLEESNTQDYWWFYALLLLICGIGALIYYYV